MANENPVSLGKDGPFIDFEIAEEHLQDDIMISITIELQEDGWTFDSDHIVTLQGSPGDLYNDNLAPDQLSIGIGEDIIGKNFRTFSRIMRIRDGAANNTPPPVKFTISFFGGGISLDEFTRTSDNTNPENFIANIKFKQ